MSAGKNQTFWTGLRGWWLVAFAAISASALLAAATSFPALLRSDASLQEIAVRKVSFTIAAPTLSNVTDPADLLADNKVKAHTSWCDDGAPFAGLHTGHLGFTGESRSGRLIVGNAE